MTKEIEIVLIGNYQPDKQESMIRFANLLQNGFCNSGIRSQIWWPTIVAGAKVKSTNNGLGKWLGYIDKYLIFPLVLKRRVKFIQQQNPGVKFHICDHSNAPYLKYLPVSRTSITCHDVIAIRGSMGYRDSFESSSKMGALLQNWIFGYLKKARSIAFVSQHTCNQYADMVRPYNLSTQNFVVIHNGFNNNFEPIDKGLAKKIITIAGMDISKPFLLHVGSGSTRKNRALLLNMGSILQNKTAVNICFAGDALDKQLYDLANNLGLSKNVFSIIKPDHQTLMALYSCCDAFIFPSLSEGFGWPLIEAQACGAAVIASNSEPMPEVSGGAALHFDPNKPQDFADGFLELQHDHLKQTLVRDGFKNCERFASTLMIDAYLNLLNGIGN